MSDIVESLREGMICEVEGAKCAVMDARSGCICAEAADEIEELRAKDQHWNEHLRTAQDEIKRLTACLKWEQNWLERVGTHAPGCWQWGPGHYLCAVRHIEEMERG